MVRPLGSRFSEPDAKMGFMGRSARPVSSKSSLEALIKGSSSISMKPPGSAQWPWNGSEFLLIKSTSGYPKVGVLSIMLSAVALGLGYSYLNLYFIDSTGAVRCFFGKPLG